MYRDYLILGGAGLVGTQVCRQICQRLSPAKIVVASLKREESEAACERLSREFPAAVRFEPAWGNLFVPRELADMPRAAVLNDPSLRGRLLSALYDQFEDAYQQNMLVNMIATHRPEAIVDCVNTATGFSYQDVFDGAARVRDWISEDGFNPSGIQDLEAFLLSQSVPQLIRHVRMLHRASLEYSTRFYLKVGTTGTGGMGLNIPYTHSEDKPSKKLLAKNEAAFGHTGLLFLFARTAGGPIVKEVKPAAMIGYRAVNVKRVSDKHGNSRLFAPKSTELESTDVLDLRESEDTYTSDGVLEVAVVDTGENGVFTRGEFAAITALGQMEYITPEEIASTIVQEIRGANTGQDVISALDGSVMSPSYKAGLVRSAALQDLIEAEDHSGRPSVALGRLGPPELSKLLFEAHLLRATYGSLSGVLSDEEGQQRDTDQMTVDVVQHLEESGVAALATSIGIPILMPDGHTLLRGPRINVPELTGHSTSVEVKNVDSVDKWARKGWIDLRASNFAVWQDRATRMIQTRADLRTEGSAAANIRSYLPASFETGEVVAWIFNNEMQGYRVK